MTQKVTKRRNLSFFACGIAIIGILSGFFVYAGIIETEEGGASSVKPAAAPYDPNTQGNTPPTNPAASLTSEQSKNLVTQVRNSAAKQQVNSILAEVYAAGPNVSQNATPLQAAIANHFGGHCIAPLERGECTSADDATAEVLTQYGDAKITSLMSSAVLEGKTQKTAQNFIQNLIDLPATAGALGVPPFASLPPGVGADVLISKPEAGDIFAQVLSEQTILSIIREPFIEMVAKRVPPNSGSGAGNYSMMQLMELEAKRRFLNQQEWFKNLFPATPAPTAPVPGQSAQESKPAIPPTVLQELASMQAYQMWMEYQRYRQMERIEALLSVIALQNFRQAKSAALLLKQSQNVGR
jgi:hypothetical protein